MRKLRMALQGDALEMIEPADVLRLLVEFDDRLMALEARPVEVWHTHSSRASGPDTTPARLRGPG